MRHTRERAGRAKRSLVSGAAFGAAAALLLSGVAVTPALAAEGEAVTGTPLSGTEATMTVTPGTELGPDGTTTVTVEGHGYDHTKPIYVGFGTNYTYDTDPEQWRKSNGGFSGGDRDLDDFNYGLPRLVIASESEDGDVADGQMDANGDWTLEVDIPGAEVPSFFGAAIDCVAEANGCGFFSFGAHGQSVAANEAYTGVSFAEPSQAVAPEITGQPESATVDEGGDATFSVTATGDPAPAYQWQRAEAGSEAFADIDGATDAGYTLSGASDEDDGARFRVVVTNEAGEATSNAAELTVTAAEEPEPGENSATGLGYNYDPEAQDQPSLTVTWPEGGIPTEGESTVDLSGENYSTGVNGNSFGGAYTLFGWVELQDAGDPGSWAPTKRGVAGKNYAYADGAGTFQSMVNYPGNTTEPGLPEMDANGDWTYEEHLVPGAKFASAQGGEVDCLAEGVQCGFMTIGAHGTRNGGVEVFTPVQFADEEPTGQAPEIASQPQSVSVDEGADATFSVEATGDPAPAYQWQRAAAGSDDWADIDGATDAEYTVTAATADDNGARFHVVVSNEAGEATSNAATLTVNVAAAEETTTRVDGQPYIDYPTDFAGEAVEVSATVAPENAEGTVEFFEGETSLGTAETASGAAKVEVSGFTGGAHAVTAKFTPADAAEFAPSEAPAATYRIVDLEPAVGEIEVGEAVKNVSDAELSWSIANYVSFGTAVGKQVVEGDDVTLTEAPEGATQNDIANREFVFSNGAGTEDADGNRRIAYSGTAQIFPGGAAEWNFTDPEVVVNAAGAGYITAEVQAVSNIDEDGPRTFEPGRIVVQTFTGAEPVEADGATAFTVAPTFEGQVAAGTWNGEFTGATLTNQFLQYVNVGVRSFFLQSGSSSDSTKAGKPLSVGFASEEITEAPVITAAPQDQTVTEGEDATFSVEATGTPAPTYQWQQLAPASEDDATEDASDDGASEGAADAEGDAAGRQARAAAADDAEWTDIDGATGASTTVEAVTLEQDGAQYRVVVSNGVGDPVVSDAVTLSVTEQADAGSDADADGGDAGGSADGGDANGTADTGGAADGAADGGDAGGAADGGSDQSASGAADGSGQAAGAAGGANGASDGSGGGLASTGSAAPFAVLGAAALMLAAVGAVLALRRRTAAE